MRRSPRHLRHLVMVLAAVTTVTSVAYLAGGATSAAGSPAPGVKPGFGITMPTIPGDLAPLKQLTSQLGVTPETVMWYDQWASTPNFPVGAAKAITASGSTPEITWEPWVSGGGVVQPAYSLASIASGAHDQYLDTWADEIRAWGGALRLRFAHEMNGDWYPWAEGVNGNGPGAYIAAWRHVHDVFSAEGVTNVVWVWSPNVSYPGSTPLDAIWPGPAYVDEVALDGYNWGALHPSTRWQSFAEVFGPSLARLEQLTSSPVYIGEVATNGPHLWKADWIHNMFRTLATWPTVRGFTWFDFNKETDWRVESTPQSLAAFRAGLQARTSL